MSGTRNEMTTEEPEAEAADQLPDRKAMSVGSFGDDFVDLEFEFVLQPEENGDPPLVGPDDPPRT